MSYSIKAKAALLFFISLFLLAGCELDDPNDVGRRLNPLAGKVGVIFTDTLTVQSSTLLVDSVVTAAGAFLLAGKYTDPRQGTVTARSFFQVQYTAPRFDLGPSPRVDSVKLFLYHDSVSAAAVTQKLRLHRLTGSIDPARNYLSTDQVAYDPAPAGEFLFARPANKKGRRDTLMFKLALSVGHDLVRAYTSTLTQADFVAAFKGFALTSDEQSSTISAFRTTDDRGATIGAVRVYYRNASDTTRRSVSFFMENQFGEGRTTLFNQVRNDRSGTVLAGLQRPYDEVPAAATGEQTYVQSITGLKTKLVIPHLGQLFRNRNIVINDAKLILEPLAAGPFSSVQPQPRQLILYEIGTNGRIQTIPVRNGSITDYYYFDLFTSPALRQVNIRLGEDGQLRRDGKYIFNLTDYFQRLAVSTQLPANQQPPNRGLVVAVPSGTLEQRTPFGANEANLWGAAFGSKQNPAKPLKLLVYYTFVNAN